MLVPCDIHPLSCQEGRWINAAENLEIDGMRVIQTGSPVTGQSEVPARPGRPCGFPTIIKRKVDRTNVQGIDIAEICEHFREVVEEGKSYIVEAEYQGC